MNTTITGESVQEVYNWYKKDSLIVNRKYQRKLVWTMDEKSNLIDTIKKEFPIPLILLAETDDKKEIIDGMQRLNAIFDFIENKVSLNGEYFDLETLGTTKKYRDDGFLKQKEPILNRDVSLSIANYKLAISIYKEGEDIEKINEIFRRINSSGRKLSRQEIRQVGLLGGFAELVSDLASKIRGDVSRDNIINLGNMSKISISMEDDHNGIKASDIYWCKQNILTKHNIRESEDEALVANIIIEIVTDKGYRISNIELDLAYGKSLEDDDDKAKKRQQEIETKLTAYGAKRLEDEFLVVFNSIKSLELQFRTKRAYIALFLAVYDLLFREQNIIDETKVEQLKKTVETTFARHVDTTQGGTWAKENITANIDVLKSAISKFFKKSKDRIFNEQKITEVENIISTSDTESVYYDFKQGFHRLYDKSEFDIDSFEKILETICAIANNNKNSSGCIIIGIADKERDKNRIEELYGEKDKSIKVSNFYVTGTNGEATKYSSRDAYYQAIATKIELAKKDFKGLKNCTIEPVNYYDRYLFFIKIESGTEPCTFKEKIFYRVGAQTTEAKTTPEILNISGRFK